MTLVPRVRARRGLGGGLLIGLAFLALPSSAAAHPLGNFTINHYTGLRIGPASIAVDHVIDMAEIPAFQERRAAIDSDRDGSISSVEEARYREVACRRQADSLELTADGRRLTLEPTGAALSFPPGVGGLLTLRLTCEYLAALPDPLTSPATISFSDRSFAERIGWREIVMAGDGTIVRASNAPTSSVSDRLRAYPQGLLGQPLDITTANGTAVPGGPLLPPLDAPELQPIGPGALTAATPGGVADLVPQLEGVLNAPDLSPAIIVASLLIAAGLGAYHAITPGHGKTVMAAYLVGTRGRLRHAAALAGIVAVAHTIGVLGLAVLVFAAQQSLPPERLVPWLGVASGTVFLVVGLGLMQARLRDLGAFRARRPAREQRDEHDRDHGHAHEHRHNGGVLDGHGAAHSHAQTPTEPALRWRSLFALGLSGGLVPAPSALLVFLGAITLGRPVFGLVLVLAFGIGMAAVLGTVGAVVVRARSVLEVRFDRARFGRFAAAAQFGAALVVVGVGLVVTLQSGARLT